MKDLVAIKQLIREDWEREICDDYSQGMRIANIAIKHHIKSKDVYDVLEKHGKLKKED